jgi:hypothetical protein
VAVRAFLLLLSSCVLCAVGPVARAPDDPPTSSHGPSRWPAPASDIGRILDEVSGERVWTTIDSLSSYWTRRCGTAENYWVGESLVSRIVELGYDEAYFDSLACDATGRAERNIVFVKPGTSSPDEYIIVGAHYDSKAPGGMAVRAPGADDNASGVAGILEMARVVRDLPLSRSVIFVLFTCEEIGLVGSQHFVEELLQTDLEVVVYINLDCLAYTDGSWQAEVRPSPEVQSLGRAVRALLSEYTSIAPHASGRLSDDWPFHEAGIATIAIEEEPLNPRINGPRDSLHYLDQLYAKDMVRGNVAALLLTAHLEGVDMPIAPATFLEETCATEVWGLGTCGVQVVGRGLRWIGRRLRVPPAEPFPG